MLERHACAWSVVLGRGLPLPRSPAWHEGGEEGQAGEGAGMEGRGLKRDGAGSSGGESARCRART